MIEGDPPPIPIAQPPPEAKPPPPPTAESIPQPVQPPSAEPVSGATATPPENASPVNAPAESQPQDPNLNPPDELDVKPAADDSTQAEPSDEIEVEAEDAASAKIQILKPVEPENATGKEKDVAAVAFATVINKANNPPERLTVGGDETTQAIRDEVNGFRAVKNYTYEETNPDGNFANIHNFPNSNLVLQEQNGSYLLVPEGPEGGATYVTITAISGRRGENFLCHVNGQAAPVEISMSTVLTQQLILTHKADAAYRTEAGRVNNQKEREKFFTDDESKIIGSYIDSLAGNRDQAAEKMKDIDDAKLKEIAVSSGLISAESVRKFVEHNLPKQETNPVRIEAENDAEKLQILAANMKHNEAVDQYLKPFEGRIVADPEAVGSLLKNYGLAEVTATVDNLQKAIQKGRDKLAWMKTGTNQMVTKDPDPGYRGSEEELTAALERNETVLNAFKEVQDLLEKSDIVLDFHQKVQQGKIKPSVVKHIDEGFASNNITQVYEKLIGENIFDDSQKKLIKDLQKYGQMGGIMGALFIFLLMKKASESGNGQPTM